ncbi:MAG: hypothetical protein HQ517_01840 [SAR324 cluster bacterium]|nr:hypothetical protein [SAR324 cluster bacterium]
MELPIRKKLTQPRRIGFIRYIERSTGYELKFSGIDFWRNQNSPFASEGFPLPKDKSQETKRIAMGQVYQF